MIVLAEYMVLKNAGKSTREFESYKKSIEDSCKIKEKCKKIVSGNNKINIGFRRFRLGMDERLLANMENNFFKYGKVMTEELIKERFDKSTTLNDLAIFICINNIPVGFGQVIYTDDGYMLGSVGIIDKYRGCGLGKLLVSYIVRASIEYGVRNLHLYVRLTNRKARKMYSSLGFKHKKYSIMLDLQKIKTIFIKYKKLKVE